MPTFEGCIEAREISLTRKGANQHAHVLIKKSLANPADPAPAVIPTDEMRKTEMAIDAAEVQKAARAITNRIMAMNEVTKAYYLGLDDGRQDAFLAKALEDQTKEAETAKADKDRAALEAEAAKTGKTTREIELEKDLGGLRGEMDTLKARLADQDIEKRADAEFAGYPGGSVEVVPLLKSYAKLPEAERIASEKVLKAQCTMARSTTKALGARKDGDVSKRVTYENEIEKKVGEVMAAKKIDHGVAYNEVIAMREFAEHAAYLQSGEED